MSLKSPTPALFGAAAAMMAVAVLLLHRTGDSPQDPQPIQDKPASSPKPNPESLVPTKSSCHSSANSNLTQLFTRLQKALHIKRDKRSKHNYRVRLICDAVDKGMFKYELKLTVLYNSTDNAAEPTFRHPDDPKPSKAEKAPKDDGRQEGHLGAQPEPNQDATTTVKIKPAKTRISNGLLLETTVFVDGKPTTVSVSSLKRVANDIKYWLANLERKHFWSAHRSTSLSGRRLKRALTLGGGHVCIDLIRRDKQLRIYFITNCPHNTTPKTHQTPPKSEEHSHSPRSEEPKLPDPLSRGVLLGSSDVSTTLATAPGTDLDNPSSERLQIKDKPSLPKLPTFSEDDWIQIIRELILEAPTPAEPERPPGLKQNSGPPLDEAPGTSARALYARLGQVSIDLSLLARANAAPITADDRYLARADPFSAAVLAPARAQVEPSAPSSRPPAPALPLAPSRPAAAPSVRVAPTSVAVSVSLAPAPPAPPAEPIPQPPLPPRPLLSPEPAAVPKNPLTHEPNFQKGSSP